jgi:hypothetical protein
MTLADQECRMEEGTSLSFERPMDRSLVHRRAVMEVFATDSARTGEDRYAVAIQAPRAHSYYNDHLLRPALIDPLLMLECCRQAATVVAHRYLGVPTATSFLISRWTTAFTGLDALRARGGAPDELVVGIVARDLKWRGDRLLAATLDSEFSVGGRLAGTSGVVAGYLSRDGYHAYREQRRGSTPPLSDGMPAHRAGVPVAPGAVGRGNADNVVLVDARRTGGGVEALVDVPVAHPAMYDHPLDHVPAMALLEAARQAAVLAVGGVGSGGSADRLYASGFDAEFSSFVELDTPVTVSARPEPGAAGPAEHRVAVDFRQSGASVCTAGITVVTVDESGR